MGLPGHHLPTSSSCGLDLDWNPLRRVMASSLLDPVAQHAADVVQARGLGVPDRNALMAGVLSQRTPKSGLFSKDSKANNFITPIDVKLTARQTKERDLRVFLFDCAIVLLTPNPNEKEKGWVLFCDVRQCSHSCLFCLCTDTDIPHVAIRIKLTRNQPIPIELLTLRAIRAPSNSLHAPQARRRSWFLDRLPAAPLPGPARAKTPPPFGALAQSSTPPSAAANGNGNSIESSDFPLVISSLGRKDLTRTWPLTLHAADVVEQRSWAQCVSTRQEEIRLHGRDGTMRGWGLTPIKIGALGGARVTCYVDYGTPQPICFWGERLMIFWTRHRCGLRQSSVMGYSRRTI